jgi:hypothetical protein
MQTLFCLFIYFLYNRSKHQIETWVMGNYIMAVCMGNYIMAVCEVLCIDIKHCITLNGPHRWMTWPKLIFS